MSDLIRSSVLIFIQFIFFFTLFPNILSFQSFCILFTAIYLQLHKKRQILINPVKRDSIRAHPSNRNLCG